MNQLNTLALVLALGLAALAVAGLGSGPGAPARSLAADPSAVQGDLMRDGTGTITAVRDRLGVVVPVAPFRRIASLGLVSDAALLEVCEPERVCAWSAFTRGPRGLRLGSQPRLNGLDNLEAVIAAKPDLVIVSTYGGEADRLARLQAAGLTVFCLGDMRGLASYAADLERIGALVGHHPEAQAAAARLRDRLGRIAASRPADAPRPRTIYVARYGELLFGGTTGTSYHDVITGAGAVDAAAGPFSGWPQYSVEQLLSLQPAVILTKTGMAEGLARLPGMSRLGPVRYVELPDWQLEDPGPGVLDAAEDLAAALDRR